jgi:putative flippase GtrA
MLSRFITTGLAAAAVHLTVALTLISYSGVAALPANLVGFLTAFAASFTGQYYWTFRSTRSLSSAIRRFFLVAFGAFLVNNVVLITLLDIDVMSEPMAVTLAVFVIPAISYALGRFWAFQ